MFDFNGRILKKSQANQYLENGMWTNETFVNLLEKNAEAYPTLTHKDQFRKLNYREMWQEAGAVAAYLYDIGIRKGDRVAIQLPNTLDYIVALFGVARIGGIGILIQTDLDNQTLKDTLQHTEAKVWIVAAYDYSQFSHEGTADISKRLPSLKKVIMQGTSTHIKQDIETFASIRNYARELTEEEIDINQPGPLDPFFMVFTSGTTGVPKGVVHLHANTLCNAYSYGRNFGIDSKQGVLNMAPISHMLGMLPGTLSPVVEGGRLLIIDRFSIKQIMQWIEEEKPSFIIGAPPHVIHIAHSQEIKYYDTSSVKRFNYAGAPIPSSILEKLQMDGGINVGCLFGWSEGLIATATTPSDSIKAVSQTVGSMIPDVEVRLVDDDGGDVLQGEIGEMWARGPGFCAGYYENPEASQKQWDSEGWFHSGDLLKQDEKGRYTFIARADDIINRGGTKIDPKNIEDVLAAHERIERLAVVGAPHETLGQQTVVCIILKNGAKPFSAAELRQFASEKGLAKFQLPDRVEFMESMPTTNSGKIMNKVLRERFQAETQK